MLPPQPVEAAANPSASTTRINARRRVLSGRPSSVIPSINKAPLNGHVLALPGTVAVTVKPANLISLPSITGLVAITALSEKRTEPPAGIITGVVKVKVVFAVGGVTVTDCPAPLRIIELNRPGRVTLTVSDATVSVTASSLVMVNVPAATVLPGAPTSFTDVLLTMAAGLGVGVGPVGLRVAVGVAFGVGAGVRAGVGFGVGGGVGFGVGFGVGGGVGSAVGFGVCVAIWVGSAVGVALGVAVGVGR